MLANFIMAFISIRFIIRQFSLKEELPYWDNLLLKALYVSIGMTIVSLLFTEKFEYIGGTLWFVIFSLIISIILLLRDGTLGKMLAYAIIPYFVFKTINDILNHYFHSFFETNSTTLNILLGGSILWMLAYAIGAWKYYRTLITEKEKNESIRKLNDELEELVIKRTVEISRQKEELVKALGELKATQAKLIQSEKLASLGELTAGVAHEIQNPLNFVNNFSEVSKEMAQELLAEAGKLNIDKDLIKELAVDIANNQEKISHHGQRASSIVKGMLEHSRSSSGKKELTDINALAEEYLKLAYNEQLAKDKSFQSDYKTYFDVSLPNLELVPHDIGRVLLNIISNAFYATNEKAQNAVSKDYKPTVKITTSILAKSSEPKANKQLQITVSDNGPGIPNAIKDKIFQPFFTTKDTGKGTGLGLSLAYDIVKAHGGEILVESGVRKGTKFMILLPV